MRSLNVFSYGGGPAPAIVPFFQNGAVNQIGLVSRQSLISAMNGPSQASLSPDAAAPAAARALQSDINGGLRGDLERKLSHIDVLLWDLLDERFGVDLLDDGSYITRSPERVKYVKTNGPARTIVFGTDEHFDLWCAAAGKFITFAKSNGLLPRTCLLDIAWALADENGMDASLPFGLSPDDANRIFARYANFLRDSGVKVLRYPDTWASREHKWGLAPFNYHDDVYRAIADKLAGVLSTMPVSRDRAASSRDPRHNAPIIEWAGLEDFDAKQEGRIHHRIAPAAGQRFELCSLIQNNGSDTLLVISHGALNRGKYTLPRFEWLASLENRVENLMFLADTALVPFDDLELAWFTGDSKDDLTKRYAELVQKTARQLGVERILFMGGSGGGFASLALASKISGSRALVFNPQTNIQKYWRTSVQRYVDRLFPEFESSAELRSLGGRTNLVSGYAAQKPLDHQIIYVQNADDGLHMDSHLAPFASAFGLKPRSGLSKDGNVRLVVENFASGHNMPYRTVLNPFVDLALSEWGKPLNRAPDSPQNQAISTLWDSAPSSTLAQPTAAESSEKMLLWLDVIFCDAETDSAVMDRYLARFLVTLRSVSQQQLPDNTDLRFVINLSRDKSHLIPKIDASLSDFPEALRASTSIHIYDHPAEGYGVAPGSPVDLVKNPNKQPGRREKLFLASSNGTDFDSYAAVIRISMDDDDLYSPGHFKQVDSLSRALLADSPNEVSAAGLYRCHLAHVADGLSRIDDVSFSRVIPGNKFFVVPREEFTKLAEFSPWSIPEYIDDEAAESFQRRGIRLTLARNNHPTFVYMRRAMNLSGQSKEHFTDEIHSSREFTDEAELVSYVAGQDYPAAPVGGWHLETLDRMLRLRCQRLPDGGIRAETNFSRMFGAGFEIAYYLMQDGVRIDTKWYSSDDVVVFNAPAGPSSVRAFIRKDGKIVDRIASRTTV